MKRILFILLLFINFTYAQHHKKVSIQLQWLDQFQFAGYYIAKEKGFYDTLGLDVEIKKFDYNISPVDEVTQGRATFGVGRSSLLINRSRGKDVVAISSIFQTSPLVLLSLKRDDLTSIKDFVGKKIMARDNIETSVSLMAMIKSQGIDERKINFLDYNFDLNDLINGKTDLIAGYLSNEPYVLKQLGYEYEVFDPKNYGFDLYSDILFTTGEFANKDNISVEKFRQATLQGWTYAFENIKESVDIIYEKYNSQNKTKEMLTYEANQLKKLAYLNTQHIGDIKKDKITRMLDIYRILGLLKNDINIDRFVYQYNYHLSSKQKDYLDNKEKIKICIDDFWRPFEYMQNPEKKGISQDYMKEFSKIIKKDINLVSTKSFKESNSFMNSGLCDASIATSYKDIEIDDIVLSTPYFSLPYVVATKSNTPYIYDIDQIKDKRIGMVRDYAYIKKIKTNYPNIEIIEFDDIDEGMRSLSSKNIFAFIDLASSISYSIKKQHLLDIKISGQLKDEWQLRLTTTHEDSLLLDTLNYSINSLSSETKNAILNKWLTVMIHKETDYSLLWQLSIFFIILFIFFLYGFQKLKKSKEIVEESLLNIQRILDTTIEAISVSDKDHNIIVINKSALDIFGYTREEFLKLNAFDVIAPDSLSKVRRAFTQSSTGQYELNLVKKDRTIFPALVAGTNIIYKNKSARVSTVINLTSLKEAQKDLEKLNNELEIRVTEELEQNLKKEKLIMQQSRLAQMGEIISMIAHQWRQPLSSISLTIVAIKLKMDLKKFDFDSKKGINEFKQYLYNQFGDIQDSISNLSTIIDDFRTFYKPNKKSVKINIDEIIEKSLNIIGISLYQDDIDVRKELNCNREISIYDNEMMQVILNILKNSQDNFTQREIEDKKIIIRTRSTQQKVILEIEDNGGGIEDDILPSIFDPYFSTKYDKNGTGLGLHMSRIIITDHHNGKLYAQNTKDGVKFVVELKR